MDVFKLVRKQLLKEKKSLFQAIKKEKEVRDSGTSAMQSWSDTTRNQAERMVIALEEQLVAIEKLLAEIKKYKDRKSNDKIQTLSFIEAEHDGNKMKIILVPEGFGGRNINDIKLISFSSPLGLMLMNKNEGVSLKYDNHTLKIISIL